MIEFKFNQKKTTQIAARLLSLNSGSMNYTKLIKLLYWIDREALKKYNSPLTGDNYYSLHLGPVLSRVKDFIDYPPSPGFGDYWNTFISSPKSYDISLKNDPGIDELSKCDIEIIDSIFDFFRDYDYIQMIDYCHKYLPEWIDPGNTSIPIQIEEIFLHIGKKPIDLVRLDEESRLDCFIDSQFSPECP